MNIPVSIGLGIVVGMTVGYLMAKFLKGTYPGYGQGDDLSVCFVHSGHIGGSACGCDPVCFIDRCDGSRDHAPEKRKELQNVCLLNSTNYGLFQKLCYLFLWEPQ